MSALVLVNHAFPNGTQAVKNFYDRTYCDVPAGSAQQASALSEINAAFISSFEPVMREVASILADGSGS
jgi:hypothetical protein